MNCKNCGTYNENGNKFCANCGASLEPAEEISNVPKEQNTIQNEAPIQLAAEQNQQNTMPTETIVNAPMTNVSNIAPNTENEKPKKEFKKEFLILGVIGALIIILGVFLVLKFLKKDDDLIVDGVDTKEIFDINRPILVRKGSKYGYITSKGDTIVEPIYDNASQFYKGHAITTSESIDGLQDEFKIIDEKGNVIMTTQGYVEPKYIQEGDVWLIDEKLYDDDLKQLTSDDYSISYEDYGYFEFTDYTNGKSGIMNAKGKELYTRPNTSVSYEISVNPYDETDVFAVISDHSNKEEAIVSLKTEKTLYTVNKDEAMIYTEDDGFFNVYNTETYDDIAYIYCVNGEIGYVVEGDNNELELYDYKNLIVQIDYSYDYAEKGQVSRYQYYDIKNKKMLDSKPEKSKEEEKTDEDYYGYKIFSSSGKQGLMSGEDIIIPCEYTKIQFLGKEIHTYLKSVYKKEYVILMQDGKSLLYDLKKKETLKTFDSNSISNNDSTFVYRTIYDDNSYTITGYEFYNLISHKSLAVESSSANIYSNYITVLNEDKTTTYYNTDLEKIYEA